MKSPFPGMDPYLEHPSLWPDVHNSLIVALRDELTTLVTPRYYVALERRTYLLKPDDIAFIGRPDMSVVRETPAVYESEPSNAGVTVLAVDMPMADEVNENYLAVYDVSTGDLITLMELLSPSNKQSEEGREQYERKRASVVATYTNLVEIDLLRAGKPMVVVGAQSESEYRILVSRGWERPREQLYAFSLHQPIPRFPLPLQKGEAEPMVDVNSVLHELYVRARFDLRLDYEAEAVPPLSAEYRSWAQTLQRLPG